MVIYVLKHIIKFIIYIFVIKASMLFIMDDEYILIYALIICLFEDKKYILMGVLFSFNFMLGIKCLLLVSMYTVIKLLLASFLKWYPYISIIIFTTFIKLTNVIDIGLKTYYNLISEIIWLICIIYIGLKVKHVLKCLVKIVRIRYLSYNSNRM